MLKQRAQVYALARQSHPRRWSGQARVWAYVDTVHRNPDKPANKEAETLKKAA